MSRRRDRQGFTLIEVMVSLGVMTVGAMAIIALQQHTIRSNGHARELTTANLIAERWVERLKQDAHTWNRAADPAVPNDDLAVLANTFWLQSIVGVTDFNAFRAIPADAVSAAFTWNGLDSLEAPNEPVFYCAAYRLAWIEFGNTMRADIRVWWVKPPSADPTIPRGDMSQFPGCNGPMANLDPGGIWYDSYHVVYTPAVIRMVPVER